MRAELIPQHWRDHGFSLPYAEKHFPKVTRQQQVAIQWARQGYGLRWKRRICQPPSSRLDLRRFYLAPFGREDWNDYMRVLHRLAWRGVITCAS